MKKRFVSALCVTLAVGMVAGCGSGSNGSGKTESPNPSSDSAKPKPELRQLGFNRNMDPNADPVAKMLEEKTGYKVKYEMLPVENADDKLNLLMANKEPYDILKLSAVQYRTLAAQGALEPLDDLLNKYGKTLLDTGNAEAFENAKLDGKIYGIPELQPRAFIGGALGIRQDLLDELGMKVPTTLDEFYQLLKAIKEKKNIIPWTGLNGITDITGAFGLPTQWMDKNGKIVNRLEDPAMKEYLAFMSKLYAEGLLDQEWPVNKVDTVQQKFTSGKAGIIMYGWSGAPAIVSAMQKTFPNSKLATIPPLKGKDGVSGALLQGGAVGYYIAIPKASKYKEDAMKYMNLKVQPELFKTLSIGDDNVHYKKEADGKLFPILPKFNDDRGNSDWFQTATDTKAYADLWLIRVRKDPNLYQAFEEIQKSISVAKRDPLHFAPPLPAFSANSQKLYKMENDYMIKVIAGAEKIDGYDKFLQQWKAQGGEEVIKEVNEWYAKQKKK